MILSVYQILLDLILACFGFVFWLTSGCICPDLVFVLFVHLLDSLKALNSSIVSVLPSVILSVCLYSDRRVEKGGGPPPASPPVSMDVSFCHK